MKREEIVKNLAAAISHKCEAAKGQEFLIMPVSSFNKEEFTCVIEKINKKTKEDLDAEQLYAWGDKVIVSDIVDFYINGMTDKLQKILSQKVLSVQQAIDRFIREYGSLARMLNPAAPAYDGYRFKETVISYTDFNGVEHQNLRAFIAHDRANKNTCIVSVSGKIVDMADFDKITVVKTASEVAKEKNAAEAAAKA